MSIYDILHLFKINGTVTIPLQISQTMLQYMQKTHIGIIYEHVRRKYMEYLLDAADCIRAIAGEVEDIIKSKYGSMKEFYGDAEWTSKSWMNFKSGKSDLPRHYLDFKVSLLDETTTEDIKRKLKEASKIYRLRVKSRKKSEEIPCTYHKYLVNFDDEYPQPAFYEGSKSVAEAYNHYYDEKSMASYLWERRYVSQAFQDSSSYPPGITAEMLVTESERKAYEAVDRISHESFWIMVELDESGEKYNKLIGIRDFGGMAQTTVSEYMFVDNILPLEAEFWLNRRLQAEDINRIIENKIEKYNIFLQNHNLNEEILIYDDYFQCAVTMIGGKRCSVFVTKKDEKWYIEECRHINLDPLTGRLLIDNELIPIDSKKITHITTEEREIFTFK